MIQPQIVNRLIPGHAGHGRNGHQPVIITLHIQEGYNDLPSFFASSGDDSTMWCMRDGTLVRMIYDTDSAWTNGYIIAPDMSNPHIAALVNAGVKNTNDYALTIEHQGFVTDQFTAAALESSAQMVAYWMQKYGWTTPDDLKWRITGHYQVGEHKNCPGPNFPWAAFRARVWQILTAAGSISAVGGGNGVDDVVTMNGFALGHGMLAYWKKLVTQGAAHPLGLPLSNEFDYVDASGKKLVAQVFERSVLGYDGSVMDPNYRVQGMLIGQEWLDKHAGVK